MLPEVIPADVVMEAVLSVADRAKSSNEFSIIGSSTNARTIMRMPRTMPPRLPISPTTKEVRLPYMVCHLLYHKIY